MSASVTAAGLSLVHFVVAVLIFVMFDSWVGWLLVGGGWFFLAVSYICSAIERRVES